MSPDTSTTFSIFISHSTQDKSFVDRLHADLTMNGVKCWYAPQDFRIGDRIRPTLDRAIETNDKLLLVLSENSINSAWVEKEVETAFEKERVLRAKGDPNPVAFFPIMIDDSVLNTTEAWAADIRRQRYIGDFRNWSNPLLYQNAINRLLKDLKI